MKRQFKELMGLSFTLITLFICHSEAQAQYCASSYTNLTDDWLDGVQFAGIDNQNTGPASYTAYTDQVGLVLTGISYEFIGTIGNNGTWNQFITVFIDFNQDQIFDNDTERFDIGNCAFDGCTIIGDIFIPLDAPPGVTRMRVIENWNSFVSGPCNIDDFGETEDYSLLIDGDCTPPNFAYTITDDCELFTYDVTATLNDFGSDLDGPNASITIYLNRSDIGDAGFVTYEDYQAGQTVDVITDVPFGVTVTASIEGTDPLCSLERTWNEEGLCPPVNNDCETPIELECWETIEGSTINGSGAPAGIDFCNGFESPASAVWYTYTATSYSSLTVSIAPDNFDAQHFVYAGGCGDLQCINGSDEEPISWLASAGQTFYIMVTGWGTSVGDFALNLECIDFPACDYPTLNTTIVDENGDEVINCLPVGDTYRVEVSLTDGYEDAYLVFVGDSSKVMVPPETHVFGTFDAGSNTNVIVSSFESPEFCNLYGLIESELCPPENDVACNAIPLDCGAYVVGSNVSASESIGCDGDSRQTVWYSYTAAANGSVFMTTCNPETNFDTDINMYTGNCDGDLVCFSGWGDGGYIDGSSACEFQSWATEGTFEAEAGVTYYIAVTGFYSVGDDNPWEGGFGLSLTCTPDESATIEGAVDWNASCGDRSVTLSLYMPNTATLVDTYSGVVNSAGEFTIGNLPEGVYDVIAKVQGSLAVGFADYEIAIGENALALGAIQRGDINGDNGINIIDFSLINASFNSVVADDNYNPIADLNCSGGVNILDVSILSPNFLVSGASAPLE